LPLQDKITGEDFSWDYSKLPNDQELNSIVWEPFALATKEQRATYPNANYYIQNNTGDKPTYFYTVDEETHGLLGFDFGGQSYVYENSIDYYRYPMNFGETYNTNFKFKGDDTDGIFSITFDGYGNLKLPSGEFEKVVRIKLLTKTVFEIKTDTVFTREYQFLQKETGQLLFRLYEGSLTTNPEQSFYSYEYFVEAFSNVNEELSRLTSIFPNPALSTITVDIPNLTINNLEILDLNGNKIMESIYTREINISDLTVGTYFVKAKLFNGEVLIKKFVKQ
jgi:hypothetical protein